nr:MAG TPA: hypothetical protein [Caudoviricetes sp.]
MRWHVNAKCDHFLTTNTVSVGCRHIPHPPRHALVVGGESLGNTPQF